MKAPEQLVTYRLIITRRSASEVLLVPSGTRWTLPRVEIRPFRRLAAELTSEASRAWSVDAYCLLAGSVLSRGPAPGAHHAVLEAARQNDQAPGGSYWVARTTAGKRCDLEENQMVTRALAELDCYVNGEKVGPFAKPGWLRDLFGWTAGQLAPLGLRLTGSFRQYNASPAFALLRLDAVERRVWFKATGEPNAHELPTTVELARLLTRYAPRVLAVHPDWNGWLAEEAEGVSLDESRDFSDWERAASDLAEFQIAAIGQHPRLLAAGLKDLRCAALVGRMEAFLTHMAELMAAQDAPTPAPLAPTELVTLGEALQDSCAVLDSCGLPDTIGQVDFNPGNIVVSRNGCTFLDWAEGCVANPLLTFEYLRQHLGRSGVGAAASGQRLLASYLRPWGRLYPLAHLRRAAAFAPPVAVLAYAVAHDTWRCREQTRNPEIAGLYRSLTRRMFREVISASQRGEPCLQ